MSFGSTYQHPVGKSRSVVQATALQMLAGGAMLVVEASLTANGRTSLAGRHRRITVGTRLADRVRQRVLFGNRLVPLEAQL